MADARLCFKPLSLQSLPPSNTPRHQNLKNFCSSSDTGEANQSIPGGVSKPVTRSSRGRTRKSLGLEEAKPSSLQPAQEALSQPAISKEREDKTNSYLSTSRENDAATILQKIKNKSTVQEQGVKYSASKSFIDWAKRNEPAAESSEHHIPDMPNSKEFSKRIQDLINADLDQRYRSDDEDIDDKDPICVEEDDPFWLDEPDEGWGYKVSDLFKEKFGVKEGKKKKEKDDDDDDVSDIPEIDWDFQPEKWSAKDVDSMSWVDTVFGDPSPLVALLYDRYGKKGRECYHVLRELEEAANRMWDCKKLPPRLVKLNVSFEEDLSAAIGVKEVPTLLFIKGGKMIHHQSGYFTADDLLRLISYFYHGAARPPCLKKVEAASMKL